MPLTLDEILNSHRTGRPVVMGVLNVTPDSFSDGGRFADPRAAVEQARRLADEGADIIDIGPESTRPGAERIGPDEQIARLAPVLPEVARLGPVVSVDTTLEPVARFAIEQGATILNDVSAGREDPRLLELARNGHVALVLMHMLGQPRTMQRDPQYENVVAEVKAFLADRLGAAQQAGAPLGRCIIDPGIGFGKKLPHNLALLAGVGELASLGVPVLIGASRKRFLGELTGQDRPDQRTWGTVAACLECYRRGATIFRVHDVAPVRQALAVAQAIAGTR